MSFHGTEHDARHDISNELWTVSELLDAEGNASAARDARDAAVNVAHGVISVNRGIKAICKYENLLEGN
ncbi:hypothetical protein SEA_LUCHADOR_96 [Mycobacterium phage Luchador]|uniref:DUF7273 domain-containing protein n=1 Tax=Mycobacterium phage Luchador TaxID=1647300 RepID=A0A0F6WDP3_9CAUD|nr:hypothetical protein AVT52_gp08 [Mycobacterium phage Luchador]AKF14260.1 hypothetical protein SEA_LUCHADOR_96 [Mycobacterium phage Luchador]